MKQTTDNDSDVEIVVSPAVRLTAGSGVQNDGDDIKDNDSNVELVVSPPVRLTAGSRVPNDNVNRDDMKDEMTSLVKKMQVDVDEGDSDKMQVDEGDSTTPDAASKLLEAASDLVVGKVNNNVILDEMTMLVDSPPCVPARAHAAGTVPNPTAPSRVVKNINVIKEGCSAMFQSIMKILTPTSAPSQTRKSSYMLADNTATRVGVSNNLQVEEDNRTQGDSVVPFVDDYVWDSLLKELNVQSFGALDDVAPIIDKYQKQSGNHVAVCRSNRDRFRLYKCVEHVNCTFRVHVGRRRLDGRYVIKKQSVMRHTNVRRPSKDKNGRQWKERRAGRVKEFVTEASKKKLGSPTTRDVITEAMLKGEVFPYHAAYRAIRQESVKVKRQAGSPKVNVKGQVGGLKKKRCRQRKNVVDASQSKIRCLRCQKLGHNRRTYNDDSKKAAAASAVDNTRI